MWEIDNGETFINLQKNLHDSAEAFQGLGKVVEAAETRLMCALAAVERATASATKKGVYPRRSTFAALRGGLSFFGGDGHSRR